MILIFDSEEVYMTTLLFRLCAVMTHASQLDGEVSFRYVMIK